MSPFDALSHKYVLEKWINERGYTHAAEIGVKQGRTHRHLLETCPTLNLLGVDVRKAPEVPEAHRSRATFIQAKSVEAAKQVQNYSLDLVFIDADHSELAVREDILAWRSKVRPGGLLCGHDVGMEGVRKAVNLLCPGWVENDQQVWSIEQWPWVTTFIPYADDRNLGRAYNECMAMLPEDGWGVLVDHDAVFTHPDWHRKIARAIAQHPEGSFVVRTNRIKCPYQSVPRVNPKNHDMRYHRQIGAQLTHYATIQDVTDDREPGGVVMICSKKAWRDIGGFAHGLHYVDRLWGLALKTVGRRIYLIEGLYVYHWHRGGGPDADPMQAGAWATQHQLPTGNVLVIEEPLGGFPRYG